MDVVHISSYPPMRGGIADYEELLVSHLRDLEGSHRVLSFEKAEGQDVQALINKDSFLSYKKAAEYLINEKPDVVHLQHELNLYGRMKFLFFATILNILLFRSNTKFITTLHTVEEYKFGLETKKLLKFVGYRLLTYNLIGILSDKIIIHNSALESRINLKNIEVIPHGVKEIERGENIRSKYDIGEEDVFLLCAGFLAPGKGFEDAIKALEYLPENYKLVIAGGEPPNMEQKSQRYVEKLKELKQNYSQSRVIIENRFIPEDELDNLIYSSDYMIFPYRNSSQSGMMHRAIGAKKKIIASDLEVFKSVLKDSASYFEWGNSEKLAERIQNFSDSEDIQCLSKNMNWNNISKQHYNCYKEAIEGC